MSVRAFLFRTLLGVAGLLLVAAAPVSGLSSADNADIPWTQPGVPAIRDVGLVPNTEANRPYDCSPLTFRLRFDRRKTMQTGCFIPAAFGLVDPARSVVIFNSSDEADDIRYGGQQIGMSVIPFSGSFIRIGGFPPVGSYLYLYGMLPNNLETGGDMFGPVYKEISSVPNVVIKDPLGAPLAINTGSLAYSARGQWLVAEAHGHAFVRINLADLSILPFAPPFFAPDNPYHVQGSSTAITEDGRYAAIASKDGKTLNIYDLSTCKQIPSNDSLQLGPQQCQSYDYWPHLTTQVPEDTITRISRLRFVRDDLLSLNITTEGGTTTENYLLSPNGPITSLIPYIGLGDSYASGQGAWNYLTGTDSAINHCHLSIRSYPLRLNGDLFSSSGHSVACSGARMQDIINKSPRYTGQSEDGRSAADRQADGSKARILRDFAPGYLAQSDFVAAYQPDVITVQIGGNDVGFKDMLLSCVSPLAAIIPPKLNPNDCYSSYEDRLEVEQTINRQYQRWVSLYKQLQQAAPTSKIFAIGYPQIVAATRRCALNTPLSAGDIDFARNAVAYINGVIQKAARATGVYYVDITDALAGYELCSGNNRQQAMNGITAGNDTLGILGQETFHPTAFGHDLIEQYILQQTHNFAVARPVTNPSEPLPVASADDPLLKTAPKSGRPVRTVIPVASVSGHVYTGGTVTIALNGVEVGLEPNTRYAVQISGVSIGSLVSGSEGNVNGSLPVSSTISGGPQVLEVSGPGPNGNPITITETVYVEVTSSDGDGDGVPNDTDSCPAVTNALQDEDNDGIDDACDGAFSPVSVTFHMTIRARGRFGQTQLNPPQ